MTGSTKEADIDIHTAPKVLPPRRDQRSLLDEDVKEDIKAEKAPSAMKPMGVKPLHLGSRLFNAPVITQR